MKENQNLRSELDDTKTTLMINKEILYKYIAQGVKMGDEEGVGLLEDLRDENRRLGDKIKSLFDERTVLEKKVLFI